MNDHPSRKAVTAAVVHGIMYDCYPVPPEPEYHRVMVALAGLYATTPAARPWRPDYALSHISAAIASAAQGCPPLERVVPGPLAGERIPHHIYRDLEIHIQTCFWHSGAYFLLDGHADVLRYAFQNIRAFRTPDQAAETARQMIDELHAKEGQISLWVPRPRQS